MGCPPHDIMQTSNLPFSTPKSRPTGRKIPSKKAPAVWRPWLTPSWSWGIWNMPANMWSPTKTPILKYLLPNLSSWKISHYLNNFSPDCALQCAKHPLLAVSWWLTDLFSDHPLKAWNSRLVNTLEAYPRYAETSLGKHQAPEGEMQFLLATITTYFHLYAYIKEFYA